MSDYRFPLQFKNVEGRRGAKTVVSGVSFEVAQGEIVALLGRNGAGKSTVMGMATGLLCPAAGEVTIFGLDPTDIRARSVLGVMLQASALPQQLRVIEILRLYGSYYPSAMTPAQAAAEAGIEDLTRRKYGALSGGQQRLVQFAIALIGRPSLLVLDEPTTGMDAAARQRFWSSIERRAGDGCAVLFTSHHDDEVRTKATRMLQMVDGRLEKIAMSASRARNFRRQAEVV
jgi:ABC-2 type transport system ATP-binding protein